MRRLLATFGCSVVIVVGLTVPARASLPVETPGCGAVLDHSIKLGADIGTAGVPCTGDGIDIGNNGVTINLNGHTIWGSATGAALTTDSFNNTHFTNGYVRGFFDGVRLFGSATGVRVDHLFVAGPSHAGIVVQGSELTITANTLTGNQRYGIYGGPVTFATVTYNTISGNGLGGIMLLSGSDDALIAHNSVHGNSGSPGDGIAVTGDRARINRNNVQGNTGWGINVAGNLAKFNYNAVKGNNSGGILVAGDAPHVVKNVADGNGWNPGPTGLGIDASNTTAPGGYGNIARNNGDPQECDPQAICSL